MHFAFDCKKGEEMKDKKLVIAVDFDGTLFENKYPEIGMPKMEIIEKCKELKVAGHTLILWTCRKGQMLRAAVAAAMLWGITFDYVNTNTTANIKKFGGDSRKIFADFYLDDRAMTLTEFLRFGEKKKEPRKAFVVPKVEEVARYCEERGNDIDPQGFVDFYTSKNWFVGKNKMKDWKAAVRTWEQRERKDRKKCGKNEKIHSHNLTDEEVSSIFTKLENVEF